MTAFNLENINTAAVADSLKFIARPRDVFDNPDTLLEVQSYLEEKFSSFGYSVCHHSFELHGKPLQNIIARPMGFSEDQPRWIIGAHFDSVAGSPGADDNATGVTALLETARILAPVLGNAPLEFIAFQAEEYGMVGSSAYVEELKASRRLVAGMLSLEMLGYSSDNPGSQHLPPLLKNRYPDTGNFLALVGDPDSKTLLETARQAFAGAPGLPVEALPLPDKGELFPETRLSDHSPFWDVGYPALLVTDTSFFRNPHYHSAQDTLETLNPDFLLRVIQGIILFVLSALELRQHPALKPSY